jgi:hypothetical protein
MKNLDRDELDLLEETLQAIMDQPPHNSRKRKRIKELISLVKMEQCSVACQ